MATDIEQIQSALTEFDRVGAGLAQLKQNYGGVIFEVDTPQGMAHAKAARLALRNPRYEVERIRKAAKAPILALGKHLDAEAARITAEIMKLEDPIDQQIKNEEDRKEKEKQAAIDAEIARVAGHRARITQIQSMAVMPAGSKSAAILARHDEVKALVIGDLQEFQAEAEIARDQAVAILFGLHAAAVSAEAEAARVAEERAELARLRAEDERRQAEARAAQQAEQARQQEEFRRQQEELNRQRAEQEAAAKAERERIAAEERVAKEKREREEAEARRLRDAEEARIAAERKKLADEQEAQRKQREAEELAKRQAQRPSDEEIVAALAAHFKVKEPTVRKWLGWEEKKAA